MNAITRSVNQCCGHFRQAMGCLAAVLCCTLAGPAAATDAPTVRTEFGIGDEVPHAELLRVEYRLETALEAHVFSNSDMSRDYDALPLARIGLTTDIGRANQFVFGLGYGRRTADLDLDDPTFESASEIELEIIPLLIGLRANMIPMQSFRVNLGLALQISRLRETAPRFDLYPRVEHGVEEATGWGRQLLIPIGPEWRWRENRFVLGSEIYGSLGGGTVGSDPDRDLDLAGFGGRIYCAWRIGSHEESTREVQR